MPKFNRARYTAVCAMVVSGWACSSSLADIIPTYTMTFDDSITGNNEFVGTDGTRRWFVSPGADGYQNEFYERPTVQTYQSVGGGAFSTTQYYQNIDITQAKVGFDSQYLYISIEMFGGSKSDQGGDSLEGMKYDYGFRFSMDADGRNGYMMKTMFSNPMSSPMFLPEKALGFLDTDGDVGGRGGPLHGNPGPTGISVTKEDNVLESVELNGYDSSVISDGLILSGAHKGETALLSRINPVNSNIVEFALDYTVLDLTMEDIASIQYLDMLAIKGDLTDPTNSFWNDKYNEAEAGSPYFDPGGFGIDGMNNIYELDTIRAGAIPAPGTLALLVAALGLSARRRRVV